MNSIWLHWVAHCGYLTSPPDMQTALCILDVVHEHGLHLHLHSQLWHGTRYNNNPDHNRRMLYFALMALSLFTVCYHVFSQLGWQAFCPRRSSIRQLGQQLTWSPAPWCGLTFSSLAWFSLFWWSVSHCINTAKKRRHILHQPKSLKALCWLSFTEWAEWVLLRAFCSRLPAVRSVRRPVSAGDQGEVSVCHHKWIPQAQL